MPGFRTILHPTDFSDCSEPARRLAIALARDYGARLVLLHAYPPPLTAAEVIDRGRADEVEGAVLDRLRDLVPADRTFGIEYRAVEGDPAEMILREAACGCDLIVLGTHGRGGLSRVLLGSTAERVSRGAPCPVATVRPSAHVPRDAALGGPVEVGCGD